MTITIEGLLTDYMTVVRQNGPTAIQNVGTVDQDDPGEIVWEIVETYERKHGPLQDEEGFTLDVLWPIARIAAQMAITICHQQVHALEIIR